METIYRTCRDKLSSPCTERVQDNCIFCDRNQFASIVYEVSLTFDTLIRGERRSDLWHVIVGRRNHCY